MNTHNIELPPMPDLPAYSSEVFDREVKVVSETMAEQLMHDYARAAIKADRQYVRYEDYAALELHNEYLLARLRKQGEQLEAIGAGGVRARRITSTPSNASAKITERSQAYLDSNLDSDEHEPFISWAREAHDYPDYARLILDSEWCQGAVAGWQGAIEADRLKREDFINDDRDSLRAEIVALKGTISDMESDRQQRGGEDWKQAVDHELTNIHSTADSFPSAKEAVKALIDWHVAVATDPAFQQPAEPAQEPSDDEIREVFLANGFTIKDGRNDLMPYVYDAARALLARYGHPVEPEGWQAAPKFGEEK